MPDATQASAVRRFGTFEINLQAGELRKRGMRLRLSGQPFQVLAVLVEHAGNVVTREELHSKLWLSDTFVDFDHGLNNAIARIRDVLDDSSETPRYVETIPRRGYRFIAPVADVRQVTVSASSAESTVSLAPKIARPDAPPPSVVTVAKRFPSRRLQMLLGGVAVLGVAALLFVQYRGRSAKGWRGPAIRSLAVLPLNNLSGDPEQEYFADGMTEALIAELGKISAPRVISRQSIMQYKGSKKGLSEIARELNVDAVLEGTVERSGDRVRVLVRLDQVSPEGQLWSNQYNRDIRDLLRLQDEIARAVTDEIQVKLKPQERTRLASSHPVNPEAQDDFLRAEFLVNKRDERDLQAGIAYFKKAIEKDPAYARAYAGLAWALVNLAEPNVGGRTKDLLPQATAAAERAVELDPSLADAHVSRALVLADDWNWSEAEKELQIALKVGPNSSDAHRSYAWYLMSMGRFDEARGQINYAGELDPVSPVNRTLLGMVALQTGQPDLAIEEFRNSGWDIGLGRAYGLKKMYPEAVAAYQRVESQRGRQPVVVANLAWVYGLAGRKHEARKLIDELNEIARHRYVAPALFVNAYLGLGDKETALTWMERGIEEHDQWFLLKVDPTLDPLRSEPRFQAALRRMNFPQ
jgi:TolB-like protein/DNA-binding winged helix-turn-helix (wHTH) protein/Flp pilus assembly protein TadD